MIRDLEEVKKLQAYEVKEEKRIQELDSLGMVLEHRRTG